MKSKDCNAEFIGEEKVCEKYAATAKDNATQDMFKEDSVSKGVEPENGGGKKKFLLIGLLVIAAVIVGAVFFMKDGKDSAKEKFISLHTNLIEKELVEVLKPYCDEDYKIATDLKMSFDMKNMEAGSAEAEILKKSYIEMKLKGDKKEAFSNMEISLGGEKIRLDTIVHQKGMQFSFPEMNDALYSISYEKIQKLSGAVSADNLDEKIKTLSDEDIKKAYEEYINTVSEAVNDKNLTVEEAEITSKEFPEYNGKGEIYTYAPDAKDLKKMLDKLDEKIREDGELRKIIENFSYAYGYSDAEQFNRDMTMEIEELQKELKDANFKKGDFVYTAKVMDGRICAIEIFDKPSNEKVFIDMFKNKKGGNFAVSTQMNGKKQNIIQNAYRVHDGKIEGELAFSKEISDFKVTYTLDSEKRAPLPFSIPYGTYEVFSEGTKVMHVDVRESNQGADLTVSLQIDEGEMDVFISEKENSSAVKPSGKPVDLDKMSQEEIMGVVQEISEYITGKVYALYGF